MKIKVLTTIVCCISTLAVVAQGPIGKGQNQLNVGVGFSSWGIPVYIGFDHGVHKDVTVGGEISYRSYTDNFGAKDYNHSITGISANGNYHFNSILNIPKSWDVYAGLNLGFYIWSSSGDYRGNGSSGLGLGAQVGARYFISNKVGLNLELGGGNAFGGGKFGVTIRL